MAKKIENLQTYWQEIATKAGIDPNQAAAIESALGDETTARAFRQAFVATPEYHSTLDSMKAEQQNYQAQVEDWYNNTAVPAYQQNLEAAEKLRQYESLYGSLDQSPSYSNAQETFNSKKELDAYLEDKLRSERAGYVGLLKTVPKLALRHFKNFNEELDLDALEQLSIKKGLTPELAYEQMIHDRVEEQRTADFNAAIKKAREEGAREALSGKNIPFDSTPKESSPFFDRTELPTRTEIDSERESRSAFLDGWENYNKTLKAS